MTHRSTLLTLSLLFCLVATACGDDDDQAGDGGPDAGSDSDGGDAGGDAAPAPCGDVTLQGECDGETLRACIDEALYELDCSTYYQDMGGTGTCELVSADLGYFCELQAGDACSFVEAEGFPVVALCAGIGAACVVLGDRSECRVDVGTCTGDETTGVCNGNNLLLGCIQTQPFSMDCAALGGGTCDPAGTLGSCVGLGEGSVCRTGNATTAALRCAGGLTCEGETADAPGTCTAQ